MSTGGAEHDDDPGGGRGIDYEARIARLLGRVRGGDPADAPSRGRGGDPAARRVRRVRDHLAGAGRGEGVWEPARRLPVLARCGVLVVGGGPAGLSAALGARAAGADVLLLERFGCFGGVITTVGMETLGWYRYEGAQDGEGIGREMERVAERMGGSTKWPYNDSQCLDADHFKVVADRLVRDSGVRPLLHCWAVEALVAGGAITGVITESKSGRQAVLAERVVDATGDADVAHLCGCPYTSLAAKERMAATAVFSCAGVDPARFRAYTERHPRTYADWGRTWEQHTTGKEDHLRSPYLEPEFERARRSGAIPDDPTTAQLGGSWSALTEAGEATNLNLAHLSGVDCTDVMDLTRAEMEGRRAAGHALTALRSEVPGFERAKLRNFAMTLGTRDSRKIVGRVSLTAEYILHQGRCEDSVGIFPEFLDGYNILVLPTTGRYFQVPLGCLVPEGVDNLLVAGRCVSGDKISHTAMRNMMACTVTGQAAGVAAAVSLRDRTGVRDTPAPAVQAELRRQGVRID